MIRFLTFLFVLIPYISWGFQENEKCNFIVEGQIFDLNTRQPLPYATVRIVGTDNGVASDIEGKFRIDNLCGDEVDLHFSYVGYKPFVHHHDPHHKLPKIYLAPEHVYLEGVIVEGEIEKSEIKSLTINEISGRSLNESQGMSLGEITSRISGVNMLSTGQNIAKPIIHGLHSNRIIILNDGIRHEYQSWGREHAPELDPALFSRIQVIKGAAAVRYGPEALGGVILVSPEEIEMNSELKGSVGISGNSNGRGGSTQFKVGQGYSKMGYRLTGSFVRFGDFESPDYYLTNTGKMEKSIGGEILYHNARLDMDISYSYTDQNLGILRGSVTGNLDDLIRAMNSDQPFYTQGFSYHVNTPRQEVSHQMVKYKMRYVLEDGVLEGNYAFQRNHRQEFDVRRGTNNELPSINLQLQTHSSDFRYIHPKIWDMFEGSLGVQWQYQDNNNLPGTNTISFVPNFNSIKSGIYLLETVNRAKNELELGLRYDLSSQSVRGRRINNDLYFDDLFFHNVTASLGLTRTFNDYSHLHTNLASAWRPPSISELFFFGKHQASIEYGMLRYSYDVDNSLIAGDVYSFRKVSIHPEWGLKWINTLEIEKNKMLLNITGYVNFIRDYIFTKPAGITNTTRGAFPFFVYDQTNSLLTGVDFDMRMDWSDNCSGEWSGSFIYARDIVNSQYFIEIPPVNLRYRNTWDMKLGKLNSVSIYMEADYTMFQFFEPALIPVKDLLNPDTETQTKIQDQNLIYDIMEVPDQYILLNAGFFISKGKWSMDINLRNILNSSYRNYMDRLRYFADEKGRSVGVGVRFRI